MGTGIKQLRENIAESKLSYEIMDDAAQAFLKTKIMDNIQKYVYMICFTGYMREQSKLAKDAGAEEFKLTGGKCKYKNCSRYDIVLDCISDRIFYVAFNSMIESVIY